MFAKLSSCMFTLSSWMSVHVLRYVRHMGHFLLRNSIVWGVTFPRRTPTSWLRLNTSLMQVMQKLWPHDSATGLVNISKQMAHVRSSSLSITCNQYRRCRLAGVLFKCYLKTMKLLTREYNRLIQELAWMVRMLLYDIISYNKLPIRCVWKRQTGMLWTDCR